MADLVKAAQASLDASTGMYAGQTPDLVAGEALGAVVPCYIKAADGKVYQSNGTAANEAAKFDGFTARAVSIGQPSRCSRHRLGSVTGQDSRSAPISSSAQPLANSPIRPQRVASARSLESSPRPTSASPNSLTQPKGES
jgi:hypothetical protein